MNDLRCRLDQLEARLATLEAKQGTLEAKQKTAYVPPPPAATEVVHFYQQCTPNCEAAAVRACKDAGFIDGKLNEWEHPRNGPLMLRGAICRRQ